MTVLERLRKRSGFLVAAVGVALLAFVLTGLFESRYSLFRGKDYVGIIGGKKISLEEFQHEVDQQEAQEIDNMEGGALDAEMKERINNSTWDKLVRDLTLRRQIDYAGITVCDEELSNMIIGKDPDPSVKALFTDNQTGRINPGFADSATGELSGTKIKRYVEQISDPGFKEGAKYYYRWKKIEQGLRENRYATKYFTLIKKGLYCTKSYAKENYKDNGTAVKFRYVLKRYPSVPDSSVKVTEEEIQKYYNENQKKYKQEASRRIEYVVWDVLPSKEDSAAAMVKIKKLADEFKATKEDSAMVARESENNFFDKNFIKKSQLPPGVDSSFFYAGKGNIFGPYNDANKVKIVKIIDEKMVADSGSARHILINYAGASQADPSVKRTKEQAKKLADSLAQVLKKNSNNFPDFVLKFSSDSGSVTEFDKETKKKKMKSRDELGAYKWFKEGQMMKAFQDAVFNGKKGDITIAETPYGFHVMEVLDKSKESKRIQVAVIEKTIEPSTKTRQEAYDKASDFALKYNTPELFNKGIDSEKLNKRIADPVAEGDKTIAGLESPREMVRWSFNNPQGTISSDPFKFGNKYVVALIAEVREKGFATLEQKRNEVEIQAKQEKKAQLFMDEFNQKLSPNITIDAFATKVNLPVQIVDNTTFGAYTVPNLGKEGTLAGVLFTLKEGQISRPIKGIQGVFVVTVDKITPAPETKDYTPTQKQVSQNMQYRVDQELFNAMKTKAEIEDNRAKYY